MSKCSGCTTQSCPSKKPQANMKQLKQAMKIKKMLIETRAHDRRTCNCKACWHYSMGFTLMNNLRLFFVVKDWKDIGRNEYLRAFQRILNYRIDKKTTKKKLTKFLKSKGAPPKQLPQIIEQMQSPMFTVMFKTSPMGMLREI